MFQTTNQFWLIQLIQLMPGWTPIIGNFDQFCRLVLAKNHGAEGGCVDIGSIGKAGNSRLKHHFS